VAGREISAKKYVVKLSAEERERVEAMICAGKHPAQSLTKARILLKADVSEAGEGWSDSAMSAALDTSINNIGRTRRRLVEEGLEAALTRKYNPNSARPRIFDGAAETKLIALTCSPAPEGFARWSLRLLEEKVVELNIVEKASDNTIDMAESELGVLSSQCLSRRIPDKPTLEKEVAAWQDHRNKRHAKANWQFTTDDARVKLKRLYPSF